MVNGYVIGVSSGMWAIKRAEELLGLHRKAGWAATAGVTFTQIDLESITEFQEPDLEYKLKRIRELGMDFGIHGEAYAMQGVDTMPLSSALHTDYGRAHERMLKHIENSGKLKAKFLTVHSSESHPFIVLGRELQPSRLVDPWGRPFEEFLEQFPQVLDWAITMKYVLEIGAHRYLRTHDYKKLLEEQEREEIQRIYEDERNFRRMANAANILTGKAFAEVTIEEIKSNFGEKEKKEAKRKLDDSLKKFIISFASTDDLSYGCEKVAYFIVAKYMMQTKHPIWKGIVGGDISDEDLPKDDFTTKWVPAVAAMYAWGHFMQDACPGGKGPFPDPKPLLDKYKIYYSFETPMAMTGYELHARMSRLFYIYHMIKNIRSEWMSITMDMEHMLGNNLDPKAEIDSLPQDAGKYLKIVHITTPSPLNPSHMPVPLGSEPQYYIYQRLWDIRKKGFKDGWMIFERGGEEGMVKQTVLSMRKIKQYLEMDISPDDLPEDFFGFEEGKPLVAIQQNLIKEHYLEPLKGLLAIPEEDYGFLSTTAIQKGKQEEWRKEKYR